MGKRIRRWVVLNLAFAVYWLALSGRVDHWPFWIYLCCWAAATLYGTLRINPQLQQERLQPGPGGEDYLLRNLALPLMVLHWGIAALDVGRLQLSTSVSDWLRWAAAPVALAGLFLWHWALLTNPFYSSVVRVQKERGHTIIDTGPYRLVRHPGYAGAIVLLLLSGILLGSWISCVPAWLLAGLILRRIPLEEAVLMRHLDGYRQYSSATRFRLVPGIW